jgi:hypothetical protein
VNHLTEDEQTLYYYGEAPDRAAAESHLDACERCRAERDRLAATLALFDRLPVPERGEAYGGEVWRRLRLRLPERAPARRLLFSWRSWALGTVVAVLLAAAFLAGRFWRLNPAGGRALTSEVRERILLTAVGDHLDRSQTALLEFVHSPSGTPDSARETRSAEDLVAANRLYRQTAASAGEAGVASVLEQLERVLLELAHDPTPESRAALTRRIEEMLFKVRVIRSQVRQRERAPLLPAARS